MQEYVQQRKRPGTLPPSFRGAETARSVPNSARLAASETQASPYSDALREKFARHQIPSAEREADRLSQGLTAQTPEQVRQQLGERLGADFSGVRFHTDAASAGRAESIGARAFATGRDVYFGQGGFDAGVAAHELVHTVQQGVVPAAVPTVSAPVGEVQMMPKWLKKVGGGIADAAAELHRLTLGKLKRSHARAEEDLLRSKKDGTWDKIGWWNKTRFAVKNPLVFLKNFRDKDVDRRYNNLVDESRWDNEEAIAQILSQNRRTVLDWKQEDEPAGGQQAQPDAQVQENAQAQPAPQKLARRPQDAGYEKAWGLLTEQVKGDSVHIREGLEHLGGIKGDKQDSIMDQIGLGKAYYDLGTGALQGVTRSIGDLARNGRKLQNSFASGVKGSTTEAAANLLSSGLKGASSTFNTVKAGVRIFGGKDRANALGVVPVPKLLSKDTILGKALGTGDKGLGVSSILSTASAGLGMAKSVGQFASNAGIHSKTKKINEEFKELYQDLRGVGRPLAEVSAEAPLGTVENQHVRKMFQSSLLARSTAKGKMIGAGFDFVDNAATVGGNFVPPFFKPLVKVGKALVSFTKDLIVDKVKKNTNKQLLNDELGMDSQVQAAARMMLARKNDFARSVAEMDDREAPEDVTLENMGRVERNELLRKAKHAVLKSYGFKSGKRSEAVGNLILERSKYLAQQANDAQNNGQSGEEAKKLVKAMRVGRVKDSEGNKSYQASDIATRMGLEGGKAGLDLIKQSRGSTIQYYANTGTGFLDSLRSFFWGAPMVKRKKKN
ncbi:MAG: DUF4157 domain-containing protein [Faecalibacterium sp.]